MRENNRSNMQAYDSIIFLIAPNIRINFEIYPYINRYKKIS